MSQDEALQILKMGYNVFLTGQAGTGKTYVLNAYIDYLKRHKIKTAVTASTGIAATHIGGLTIHSWSGLGVKESLSDEDIDALSQKERIHKHITQTKVLIIDEVSMLSGDQLAGIEKLSRVIRQNNEPFGGMQVVLVGDFFQLPPVTKGSVPQFAFEHTVWKSLKLAICYLTTQFRQDDARLERVLASIRDGSVDEDTVETLQERIITVSDDSNTTKLFTHNVNVDTYNEKRLADITSTSKMYMMESSGSAALVESLKKGCLAPEQLVLKKGARVMFLKNNYEKGYVNGSIGHVFSDKGKYPMIELLDGKIIEALPETWQVEDGGKVRAQISQIPLRLAWAITVHKSQGMSLDEAVMDLSNCFVAGQGYVALSRVRSLEGITLLGIGNMALQMDERVRDFDHRAQETSEKTSARLESLEMREVSEKQAQFILRSGGSLEAVSDEELIKGKESTYDITLKCILQKKSLHEIAHERGLTLETIVGHIEHLRTTHTQLDIEYLKPRDADIKKIHEAFHKLATTSLSPVKNKLGEKFTFLEIRIARLFLE
jgi:ATP-dependent exoDNAse (exonuclease V) alpha subunit